MKRLAAITIGAASLLACSVDSPTAPELETSLLSSQLLRVGGGPSVTGGWRDVFAAGPPTGFRNVSLSAVSTGRGTVKGHLHINSRTPGSDRNWHGSVDCLIVVGNRATVGGEILRTREAEGNTFELIPGTRWWMQVVDNGEGLRSAPDERSSTLANSTLTCEAVLDDLGDVATVPITNGNIQVRP